MVAKYGVVFNYDCFSCWTEILSIVPSNVSAAKIELNDVRIKEIESALAYLIVDEAEDLSAYEQAKSAY